MRISFSKYQGTGNDFILIDNRVNPGEFTRAQIAHLCDRRFGIGADGLILLNAHPQYHFEMKNYNSDGGECSMCGNGARSLVKFAADLQMIKDHYHFLAIDGEHEVRIDSKDKNLIQLKMKEVNDVNETPVGFVLDTGSPHLVCQTKELMMFDVVGEGRKLRNSPMFMPAGINVNFVENFGDHKIFVRTYERGVEDETLSCGTGVIAAALTSGLGSGPHEIDVQTRGGTLRVHFDQKTKSHFENIWLIGPAEKTFEGVIEL